MKKMKIRLNLAVRSYKNLKSEHQKVNKLLLYISIGALAATKILPEETLPVGYNTALSICGSLIISAITVISVNMWEVIRDEEEKVCFCNLLGTDKQSENNFIVIPKFPKELLHDIRNCKIEGIPILEATRTCDELGCFKSILFGDTDFASIEDLEAVITIKDCFKRLKLKEPKLIFDDDAVNILRQRNNTTFIAVGLKSNLLTMKINSFDKSQRLFEIEDDPTLAIRIPSEKDHKKNEWDENSPVFSDKMNHALVTKVILRENNNIVFIVGGIIAPKTNHAASILCNGFLTNFLKSRDPKTNQIKNGSPFSIIIESIGGDFNRYIRVEEYSP